MAATAAAAADAAAVFCRGRSRRRSGRRAQPSAQTRMSTVELGAECWEGQGSQLSLLSLPEQRLGRHFPRRPGRHSSSPGTSSWHTRRENGAPSPAFSPRRAAHSSSSQAQHRPSTPADPHRRRGSASNCARAHRTSPRKTPREWQRGAAAQHHTIRRPVSPLHFSPPPPLSSLQESVQTFGRKKTAAAVSYCKKGRGSIKINGCLIELVEPEVLYKVFEPILPSAASASPTWTSASA